MNTIKNEDKTLWKTVTATVAPLRKRDLAPWPTPAAGRRPPKIPGLLGETWGSSLDRNSGKNLTLDRALPHRSDFYPSKSLDPSIKRSVRKRIQPEACLDLHGRSCQQAYRDLTHFLGCAQARGHKWVLVITGKGNPPALLAHTLPNNHGILRREVPLWLSAWPQVSSFCTAKPQDGGTGALYVRLKTKEDRLP